MGLDMYLTGERFIFSSEKQLTNVVKKRLGIDKEVDIGRCEKVIFDLMYWRKANMIHKWFVDNCQEGNDDCERHYVEIKQLEELLEVVKEVLKNKEKAKELLPVCPGFFFGAYEYDKYYFAQLKYTKKELTKLIKTLKKLKGFNIYYRSSW